MRGVPAFAVAGRTVKGPISSRICIDDRPYLNFFGGGYLALAAIPDIRAQVACALEQGVPFGRQLAAAAGAADPVFDAVEQAAAAACGAEASVYFASGYFIGMVGLKALDPAADVLFIDEVAHHNLMDAAKLSGLPTVQIAHCDVEALRGALHRHVKPGQRPLMMTDGVFATTGRVPPLREYRAVLQPYEGRMFVDEAHAFGVIGNNGRGAAEYCGVEDDASVGATLSKALCAQGAFVACSAATASQLRLHTPVRGACAGSPLSAVAATASLNYLARHPELRSDLHSMAQYFRTQVRSRGLEVIDSPAPIVAFQRGCFADMQALQHRLFDRGIHVHHSSYVGAGVEGVIRCAVFRDHSREDIDALIAELG